MRRAIDKGLANSRIGLVLVTPAMLERLSKENVADKELFALLERNQLVPIVHNTPMKLCAILALCLPLELDWMLLKTQWKLSREKSPSW